MPNSLRGTLTCSSTRTASVVPDGRLLIGTPNTVGCARCGGLRPTAHGFIAPAHTGSRAQRAPTADGPAFIPTPEGRGT